MANTHAGHAIKNPGSAEFAGGLKALFGVFFLIGVACFAYGLNSSPARAWSAYIVNHFFFMSLALGGLFFVGVSWISNAMWIAPIRRISESFTAYLPIALITTAILAFGVSHLYSWSHPEIVHGDVVLEGKSGYLSLPFFMIRSLAAVVIWIFFAWKMVGNSLKQDSTKDLGLSNCNRKLAAPFLVVFGLTFTISSFDQLMSLEPHWYSTMFGVYCFAGLFYSVLALTCVVTLYLQAKGKLAGIVNDNHLHDIGKFMFAFTVFWAYIGFFQFMLIWYANMPEETSYFLHRFNSGWGPVSIFLVAGKFMVPFFFLLPRDSKRNPRMLLGVGIFMLVAQWVDVFWMVQPVAQPEGPAFGIIEIGTTLGFIGMFGWAVMQFLARHNVVCIGDPRLEESVFHHHV